jgi:hypothetical protein
MPARMAASVVVLSLLLGRSAQAQDATRATDPPAPYPSPTIPQNPNPYYTTRPAGDGTAIPERKSLFIEKPAGSYSLPPAGLQAPVSPYQPATGPGGNYLSTGYQSPKPQPGTVSPAPSGASPAVGDGRGGEVQEYYIQLEPPGPQELFGRLDSEAALQERIRQKARERTPIERVEFPVEPIVGKGPFVPRSFTESKMAVEPTFVCHGRLYFEQINAERYGWDIGPIAPVVSAGIFFKDMAFLPYHAFTNPLRYYECNTGYCLPGDPVPLMLYPPGLSLTGAFMESGIGVALFAIFP